ncbi:His/Glu/Gln/Arg/opine family amino acid ABC transporter permease subunit [Bradyrhizobium betae]|nr:His/Glu/Gln/Arg/opine family amino acid ABC transporter permease subunit [Bradyrhizobium betae]
MSLFFHYLSMPYLLEGIELTLEVTALGLGGGLILGLILAGMQLSRFWVLAAIARAYTVIFRGTPLILQMVFAYDALPHIGIKLPAVLAAGLALACNEAPFIAEMLRAGVLGVDRGQVTAGHALGMTPRILMWRVIAPQAAGQRGVSRSSRNVGWAAVDASHIGAMGIAGRATVSDSRRAHDRCDLRTAKSCGPGARRLAPSLVVMWRPDRVRASAICKATGAIVHRSPGRARHKPSNHCAGKAGCLASPVCRCAASCSATFAQWTAGVSRHPVFPTPSDI